MRCICVIILVINISFNSYGQTGPNTPSTETEVFEIGPSGGWDVFNNTSASDDLYDEQYLPGTTYTYKLKSTGFSFNIPIGDIIDGIEVEYEIHSDATGGAPLEIEHVQLIKSNVNTGSVYGAATPLQTINNSNVILGGSTDNWGSSYTPADINASDFGVGLIVYNPTNSQTSVYVDYIGITVYHHTPPLVNLITNNVLCNGESTGDATPSVSGGATPFTYLWENGSTVSVRTGIAAGTYSVTVTDANLESDASAATITEPTLLVASIASNSSVTCNGFNDGVLGGNAGGGTPGYTVLWSNGQTTFTNTGLSAGSFVMTVTDANGCISSVSDVITEPSAISFNTTVTDADCFGAFTGAINLTTTGGSSPYLFNWNVGNTSEDISGRAAGSYTLTVTDNNSCEQITSATVSEPTEVIPTIDSYSDITCFGANDGTLSSSATGGTTPYSFQWRESGNSLLGQTSSTIVGRTTGDYSVRVIDGAGCLVYSSAQTITEPTLLVATTNANQLICAGDAIAIGGAPTASGGTTSYSYNWEPATNINNATIENPTVNPSVTTVYSVTVTDFNNCTSVDALTITVNAAPTINAGVDHLVCSGESTTLSGSGAISYLWDNSVIDGNAFVPSSTRPYNVTGTDANGCTSTDQVIITVSSNPLPNLAGFTHASCNGMSDGTLTVSVVSGTTPYSYLWTSGDAAATATGLGAGNYICTVADDNGCTGTANGNVNQQSAIVAKAGVDMAICDGGNAIIGGASPTGGVPPYNYAWDNNTLLDDESVRNPTAMPITTTVFTLTVTDADNCTGTDVMVLSVNPAISLSITPSNVTSNGGSDGSAYVNATGGSGVFIYAWSSGGATTVETGLSSGTYTVTVTDDIGCEGQSSVSISENVITPILVTITESYSNQCFGNCDAVLTSSVLGGVTPYTYLWTNGMTSSFSENTCAGVVNVTVADNNGASVVQSFTLSEPSPMIVSATSTEESATGACDGTASVSVVANGQSPYSYSWPDMQFTESISGLCEGEYEINVNDANGCQGVDTAVVGSAAQAALSATSVVVDLNCAIKCDGKITLTPQGGQSPYNYQWSNGANGSIMVGLCAGEYSYTITDDLAQSISAIITITSPLAMEVSTSTTQSICGNSNGSASVSVQGGVTPYTYSWSTGSQLTTISGLSGGAYSVSIIDGNSCLKKGTAVIGDVNGPSVSILTVTDANCGGADGTILVGAFGGASPYSYQWDNGVNGLIIMDALAGDHHVAVTDANGCVGSATATVGDVGGVAPTLSGVVTNLFDGLPIIDGQVEVYGYNPYRARMDIVATGVINSDGSYFIPQVLPIGQYFVVGRANSNLPQYANMVPTYYGATYNWAVAPMLTASCNAQLAADIEVIDLIPLVGTSVIGGILQYDGLNKSGRAGDPIPGIDIALEQIPGGIIAFTNSDNDGKFEFNQLPQTGVDTTYGILVNMPGMDVVQKYDNITINSEDSINLGFTILASDSTLYTDQISVLNDFDVDNTSSMKLYPNPFSKKAYVGFELKEASIVSLEVFNVLGEKISEKNYGQLSTGKYTDELTTEDNNSGIYIVKLKIGNNVYVQKLFSIK